MVTIRPAAADDLDAMRRVRGLAFAAPRDDSWTVPNDRWRALVADVDGRVSATLLTWAYGQFFGGKSVPMGGVATVAVDPHARGRGIAGALLRQALADMRDAGQSVSALYPAAPPLYRAYGWEQAGVWERVTLPLEPFTQLPDPRLRLRPATEADLPALHACYLAMASTVDGMLDRAAPAFDMGRVLDLGVVDVIDGDDGLRGYLTADNVNGELVVHDVVARDADAAHTLLRAIASWGGVMSEVSLRMADPLVHEVVLGMPWHHPQVKPWMLRVVDLPAAVAARGWAEHVPDFVVDLDIVDEHAPWQAGRHRLVRESGETRVEPGGTGTVRMTARALAPWFAGAATTDTLRRAGLLDGHAPMLDAATGAPTRLRMADAF